MGCDVHPFIEYQIGDAGYWYSFSQGELELSRNYALFGYMAGVRGFGPAIVEPKGIPDGLSYRVRDQWVEVGEHTPSWLTLKECRQVSVLMEENSDWDPPLEWPIIVSIMEQLQNATKKPTRLVFWFDS